MAPLTTWTKRALTILSGVLIGGSALASENPRSSPGCRHETIEHGRRLKRRIDVDGTTRHYILDVPEAASARRPAPLLFDFHGFGHSAAGVWQVSKFRDLAEGEGFITVYPDGLPVRLIGREAPGWEIFGAQTNRDLAFVRRLLNHLEAEYCIDRNRVFTTGFSNGAFFSHLLGCAMPDRFAAIAPVSGGQITVPCQPSRPVPVLIHHGRRDELIPTERARKARDAWLRINGCGKAVAGECERHQGCRSGAEVVYCEGDFTHHWPVEATQRIWSFFRRHPMR